MSLIDRVGDLIIHAMAPRTGTAQNFMASMTTMGLFQYWGSTSLDELCYFSHRTFAPLQCSHPTSFFLFRDGVGKEQQKAVQLLREHGRNGASY